MVRKCDGTVSYDINTDGTLTVQTCKESSESIDILEDVYNDKGQLIHYETNDATVSLEYNQKNKISKMIENGVQTKYTYSKNGFVEQKPFTLEGVNITHTSHAGI